MPPSRSLRLLAALGLSTALMAALTGQVQSASASQAPGTATAGRLTASDPTNAGKIYRWGWAKWKDEYIDPLSRQWQVNRPHRVENRFGMLTLKARPDGGAVVAALRGQAHRYGRWETRIRVKQFTSGHPAYRVVAELVPAGARPYHCGARNITLADYVLGSKRAGMSIRTLPDVQFSSSKRRNLAPLQWHTFAVEVTRTHVSWFVDARVVMTERRPAALSGAKYQFRFRFVGVGGPQDSPPWMQMDWTRYYTLERPNARSIKAPRAQRGSFPGAC